MNKIIIVTCNGIEYSRSEFIIISTDLKREAIIQFRWKSYTETDLRRVNYRQCIFCRHTRWAGPRQLLQIYDDIRYPHFLLLVRLCNLNSPIGTFQRSNLSRFHSSIWLLEMINLLKSYRRIYAPSKFNLLMEDTYRWNDCYYYHSLFVYSIIWVEIFHEWSYNDLIKLNEYAQF